MSTSLRRYNVVGGGAAVGGYNPSEISMALKSARMRLTSLSKVTKVAHLLPEALQAEAFDVFLYHLQKSSDSIKHHPRRSRGDFSTKWILQSMVGMRGLGSSYFSIDGDHKQQFITSWQHIVKWLRALNDRGDFGGQEEEYFREASAVYNFAFLTQEKLLDEADVVLLAVRLWNGHSSTEGLNYFTPHPLLTCLNRQIGAKDTRNILRVLFEHENSPTQLTSKIITRIVESTTMSESSPTSVNMVASLTNMLGHLSALHNETLSEILFSPRMGRCLVENLKKIMDAPGAVASQDHIFAARSTISSLGFCISRDYAQDIIDAGFLPVLLKIASLATSDLSDTGTIMDDSNLSLVLDNLRRHLVFGSAVSASRNEIHNLYLGHLRTEDLLVLAPEAFQNSWLNFETFLFEQVVLSRFFQLGFAPESGVCANYRCNKTRLRENFKKCAGCSFVLYCSSVCQRSDWSFHRGWCKLIKEEDLRFIETPSNRFPRRIASLQISRYWDDIVALGQAKSISKERIAVLFDYRLCPFKIEVSDCDKFLDGDVYPAHIVLAANHFARRPPGNYSDCLLVVAVPNRKFPCFACPDDQWTKSIGIDVMMNTNADEGPIYFDRDGNALVCKNVDAIRQGIRLCRAYALESGESVWSDTVLHKAVDEVIAAFGDVLKLDE